MIHESAACASLPKVHVTLRATWCVAHMAWEMSHHVYSEAGESISDVVPYTPVGFGPFDSTQDVLTAMQAAAARDMAQVDPATL